MIAEALKENHSITNVDLVRIVSSFLFYLIFLVLFAEEVGFLNLIRALFYICSYGWNSANFTGGK